jgi:phosphoribosylglycinamide formyltransferase-1
VCDKEQAYVIKRAKKANIPVFTFNPKAYVSKAAFEEEIVGELKKRNISFVVLAGYMRLIGSTLLAAYESNIVNIHPSMLPAFPGKDAILQALQAGVESTGITVHYVDAGMDTGPIIAQEAIPVLQGDTEETLASRVHEVEHYFYPQTLQQLFTETTN